MNDDSAPPAPTRAEAFRYWLKLGFVSFGGPAGQIAIMHHDLVDAKRWISERRFLHALNYCMVLPGPEAQQLATYIGWLMHRTWGGIVAGGLFVLPSLVILIALTWLYMTYGDVPAVAGVLYGIKPAVVAIVLHAAWRIGTRALKRPILWVIAAAAFVAIFALAVPFPAIVLAAGAVGYLGGRIAPREFVVGAAHDAKKAAHAKAVIDDDTPTPAHARFRWSRLAVVVIVSVAAWLFGLAMLVASYGPGSTLARMGWFFTKAALLTFGGAYAVLPYVYQGAVETYAWLTPVADDRRPGPRRDHARSAHHDRRVRRLRRRLDEDAVRRGLAGARRHRRRLRRDVLHVPAVVRVHPRRRPAGGIDARPAALHRAAVGDHGRGGRRHRQSRVVLRAGTCSGLMDGTPLRHCAESIRRDSSSALPPRSRCSASRPA